MAREENDKPVKTDYADRAFERWDNRQLRHGRDNYFEEGRRESHFSNVRGRIQSNMGGLLRVIMIILLALMQIAMIVILQFYITQNTVYFYMLIEIFALLGIVSIVNNNSSPAYKIGWISIITLLPIAGFIMFFIWGRRTKYRTRKDKYINSMIKYGEQFVDQDKNVLNEYLKKNPLDGRMVKGLNASGSFLSRNNDVRFFSMGEDAWDAIIDDMEKAEHFILIDFFIVAEGALWDKVYAVLKKKINEGVEVKFLYDDFGSSIRVRKYFRQILESEGIEVRVFNPMGEHINRLYLNFRSHQKIVVIDGRVGFTGGFNIADEYANLIERFGIWKDTGVRVAGDAVWGLTVVFLQMWEASTENLKEHVDYKKYKYNISDDRPVGNTYCEVIADGPSNNPRNPAEQLYNEMIVCSDKYLYVTTPYLVPDDYMKQQLVAAVDRGVDVRIITPHIPDKKIVYMLTNYNYGMLLKNGVRIYEYTPGFIHAKQMLSDSAVIVGTINMDFRSFNLHYENGIWMSGKRICDDIMNDFQRTFHESHEVTYEEWKKRPLPLKVIQPLINMFSTLM